MTRTVLLGDITTKIGSGATPRGGANAYLDEGPFALIRSQNVRDGAFDYNGLAFINEEQAGKLKNVEVQPQDVLINITGDSVARVGRVPKDILPARVNQHVAIIRPDEHDVDSRFLYYSLIEPRMNKRLLTLASSGATRNALTKIQLEKLKIELPNLETQKKIADILSSIDEKIELNRKMNETLEQMGQALFRHYFIDNPEAEKWNKKTIAELCDVKIGRTPPRKESEWFDKNDGETWVSIRDMGQGATFISDSSEYLNKDAVTRFNVPAIEPNTVLLSFKLTVGRLCISTKRMYSNEAIAQLPLRGSEVSIEYLYYFLRNFNYSQLSSTSSIATAVNSTTLKNIKITTPAETAMKDFTSQAHNILEAVKSNEAEIQTLTTLRNTLLPRLISGKIKVNE